MAGSSIGVYCRGLMCSMLTDRELERYSRQIPLIGEQNQERLKSARVFPARARGSGMSGVGIPYRGRSGALVITGGGSRVNTPGDRVMV